MQGQVPIAHPFLEGYYVAFEETINFVDPNSVMRLSFACSLFADLAYTVSTRNWAIDFVGLSPLCCTV